MTKCRKDVDFYDIVIDTIHNAVFLIQTTRPSLFCKIL